MKINMDLYMDEINSEKITSPVNQQYEIESKKNLKKFEKKLKNYTTAIINASKYYVK